MEFKHKPVMLNECIENLNIKPDGIYIDGTLGAGGHSKEILKKLSFDGLLIGIDRDIEAIDASKENLKEYKNIIYINDSHENLLNILKENNIQKVDGILLDLGISSYQIDNPERGFSYMKDGPLDMRMDKGQPLTAKKIINTYSPEKLQKIFYEYGEEKNSKKIVEAICKYRKAREIKTTKELVSIIDAVRQSNVKGHSSKKVFQALRIETNNEIEPLYNFVYEITNTLNSKGRLCIITFHSLEDRAVKKAMVDSCGRCTCPKDFPKCICNAKEEGKIISKKPILPTKGELKENSRSASAKLRVFEKK